MTLILNGTDGLSDVDGSAATPAIRGTDANTGIFFPAADTIAFAEGGAEIARFDSSGNLGVGTASPAAKLELGSGTLLLSNNVFLQQKDSSGNVKNVAGVNASNQYSCGGIDGSSTINMVRAFVAGNEALRIDSSSNVLVIGGGRLYLYNTPPNIGIDGTNSNVTITNGNSIDFSSFSGTLMVTEKNTTGSSAILLCGGTSTAVVGQTNGTNYTTSSSSGNIRWFWNPGSSAFRLQNNQGSTLVFSMVVVKTRDSP
jgi:hypothetical protein